MWQLFYDYLLPGAAEQDPGFRREIHRLSRFALSIIGAIQIVVSLLLLLAGTLFSSGLDSPARLTRGALLIALGLWNLVAARVKPLEPWYRAFACVSGLATIAVLIATGNSRASSNAGGENFIAGQTSLVMLVALTLVPLQPVHTLILGTGMAAIYGLFSFPGLDPMQSRNLLFILAQTLLCAALTAVVYRQRIANFELRRTQTRSMLAESASSMARLAAALSHELNNPVGALLSGVDTLLLLASKQDTYSPSEQSRLVMLQADIRKSIQQSADSLKLLVARMQRFTNLDQAEVQPANLNDLLTDVAALVEPHVQQGARIELQLEPIPPVVCRPQQLSAVFSSLVTNALDALGDSGTVVISTRPGTREVEIEISDTGRGVDPSEISRIFDPTFKTAGMRIGTGNWSMFTSRQIVREHGGEIRMDSSPGVGTRVRLTFPALPESEAPAVQPAPR